MRREQKTHDEHKPERDPIHNPSLIRLSISTCFAFPAEQRKCLRTTNAIERLNEEFRRRVKTQGSLPTEEAAMVLLYGLVASGQIKLRKIDAPHLVRVALASPIAQRRAA
ncbi:MAG TPA: transposase [Candidatus Eisenbacteria bacterium]|nr:transposase [Candidatus Eisenbacteria bacterium]